MADNRDNLPPTNDEVPVTPPPERVGEGDRPANAGPVDSHPPEDLGPRLERLGGEPAPDITPDEFVRLQKAGQIHIDPRGRVRTTQRDETDAGISLRKRRAWYRPL